MPAEYVTEHTHLAYASTAYGVQGATVAESHTVVGDAIGAAGVYVGMTRGRSSNRLHLVAADMDDAREQFVVATGRDRADRGLTNATAAARESVSGLTTGAEKRHRTMHPMDETAFGRDSASSAAPELGCGDEDSGSLALVTGYATGTRCGSP